MTTTNSELAKFDQLPDNAYIRMPTMTALYGNVTPACLYRWVKKGFVPKPRKLGR